MPLEPQAEALLKKLVDSGVQPFETMTLAESRGPSSNGTKTWCFRVVPEGN